MQSLDLLCLLGELDDGMIADAKAEYKSKTPRIVKWGALAACCCLIAAAAFSAPKLLPGRERNETPPVAAQQSADTPAERPAPGVDAPAADVTLELPAPDPNNPRDTDSADYEPSEMFGPMLREGEEPQITEVQMMIQSFGDAPLVDMAVENGGCCCSQQLVDALAACGDSVRYRVTVELFHDGVQIPGSSADALAEMNRLADEGIITAVESLSDGTATQTVLTLHATADQIAEFPARPEYGYFLMLYNEYFGPQAGGGEIPEVVYGQPDVIFGINENFR